MDQNTGERSDTGSGKGTKVVEIDGRVVFT